MTYDTELPEMLTFSQEHYPWFVLLGTLVSQNTVVLKLPATQSNTIKYM